MKKFLVQIVIILAIIIIALYFFGPNRPGPKIILPFIPKQAEFKEMVINDKTIKVEVADTQEKRNKGLGERDSLAEGEGMLFIYSTLGKYPFWMKGLKFPLDFVWIKDDKVVDIIKNASPPVLNTKDEDLPLYLPKSEVNKILEVNAGMVDKLGIKLGDSLNILNSSK